MERARLTAGSLLALRTGRGAWHAEESVPTSFEDGQADAEFRGVLFWVNLAGGQAGGAQRARPPARRRSRWEGDATVRVLVGGALVSWNAAVDFDVEPEGGRSRRRSGPSSRARHSEGEAAFGELATGEAAQLVLLGHGGDELRVTDAAAGTRFLIMAGQPYGEMPVFNGPFVD